MPLWTNRYNGPANSFDWTQAVAVDESGNAFVAGQSYDHTNYFYTTIKYSAAGVPLWTNRYNGNGHTNNILKAMAVDGNGNVFVTGYCDMGTSSDYVMVAYSNAGLPLWTNHYLSPFITGVPADLVSGTHGNVFTTSSDFSTFAISTAGVLLWTNKFQEPGRYCRAAKLAVDTNGNVFVTGYSAHSDPSICDFATVAYSVTGVPLWTNYFNETGTHNCQSRAIAVDRGGNVFVTGFFGALFPATSGFATIKYSGAGVPLWTNHFGGGYNVQISSAGLAVDAGENLLVTGSSYNGSSYDYTTIKYSGEGLPLWTNFYTASGSYSNHQPVAVAVDGSGNVFVTGNTTFINGTGSAYRTVAYSAAGVLLWAHFYKNKISVGDDYAVGLAADRNGNVFVTGYSNSTQSGDGDPDFITIKYSGITATPATLTQATAADGQFGFTFGVNSNRAYSVEFVDFLTSSNWLTLTNIDAQTTATNIAVTNAMTNNARFYRVRTP